MRFGTAVKDYKGSASGGSGGGRFISWLKEGDNVLRLLEEYPSWTVYYQHFDRERRRGYPCNQEDRANCPGCIEKAEDERQAEIEDRAPRIWGAQKFYLVNALNEQGYVNLYQIPAKAISTFERYSIKYDTLTDREYTIVKYKGDDGNWKYDVERGDRDEIDISQYKDRLIDHNTALENAYNDLWGSGVEKPIKAPPVEDKPRPKSADLPKQSPARGEDPTPTQRGTKGDTTRKSDWNSPPPSEPDGAAEPDQADDETLTLDEADLRKMTWKELVGLIAQCELPVPSTREPSELADYLIEKLNA